jgi:hypothetical protein
VAASTLAGSTDLPHWKLILPVVVTNLVYFGTHVFAYAIADPDSSARSPSTMPE